MITTNILKILGNKYVFLKNSKPALSEDLLYIIFCPRFYDVCLPYARVSTTACILRLNFFLFLSHCIIYVYLGCRRNINLFTHHTHTLAGNLISERDNCYTVFKVNQSRSYRVLFMQKRDYKRYEDSL